ncbi:hypothetical protein [Candidatus Mycobacterium methanotrophicum]|uniref:Uncharacterized protein n=1 Tax=Candidatus Mycobacterium methanotrophicum TaxID=2943498 RepID=A0ABY4QM45_9MYCO|nr:hypothetical protein [Candidatus Mycobacterium methanotrophicum]UQX11317.1 hypothetical protein M5I08_01900 [Candidatus Mycobacterium methanotrophicum]
MAQIIKIAHTQTGETRFVPETKLADTLVNEFLPPGLKPSAVAGAHEIQQLVIERQPSCRLDDLLHIYDLIIEFCGFDEDCVKEVEAAAEGTGYTPAEYVLGLAEYLKRTRPASRADERTRNRVRV